VTNIHDGLKSVEGVEALQHVVLKVSEELKLLLQWDACVLVSNLYITTV